MISKLETAGLGYHVNITNTYEKIGENFIVTSLADFKSEIWSTLKQLTVKSRHKCSIHDDLVTGKGLAKKEEF